MAEWNLEEAIGWYRKQGAPGNQTAVRELLKEVQSHFGGSVPNGMISSIAESLGVKPGLLLALIRRTPSLWLGDVHVLELCAGPNCGKHTNLAACAEKLQKEKGFSLKFVPCMRLCGKGPNIRWDGKLYHRADEALLRQLTEE